MGKRSRSVLIVFPGVDGVCGADSEVVGASVQATSMTAEQANRLSMGFIP
jgi:hypothetical protein